MRTPHTIQSRTVSYRADSNDEQRDGIIVEMNGALRLIRDEETGEEVYRFQHELSS
jgi:hypothetical protein